MTRTGWYPAAINPVRKGWYEIQDNSLRCGCCCMEAYWNGSEFVRFGMHVGLGVYQVFRNVTKWRGLVDRAS